MTLPSASKETHAVMGAWHLGKPVAGLMGEFSSGKSTLLNFILAQDVATTKVTATPLPPIWFTHSDTPFCVGLLGNGTIEDVDLADPAIDFRGTYLAIRRGINSDALKRCDIIDCPGISDPELGKNALRFLQPYFDFVIWCTGASQAWRQTDKVAFQKLSRATRMNSFLAVTRIDKLRTDRDRAKVLKRVTSETGDLFSNIIGLQTLKAAAVPESERRDDALSVWAKTGGLDFMNALDTAVNATQSKVKKSGKPATQKKPARPSPIAPDTAAKQQKKAPAAAGESCGAASLIEALEMVKTRPGSDRYCSTIDHLIASIACKKAEQKRGVTVSHACSQIEADDLEIERLLSQIEREIRAFGDGDTIRLDTYP